MTDNNNNNNNNDVIQIDFTQKQQQEQNYGLSDSTEDQEELVMDSTERDLETLKNLLPELKGYVLIGFNEEDESTVLQSGTLTVATLLGTLEMMKHAFLTETHNTDPNRQPPFNVKFDQDFEDDD